MAWNKPNNNDKKPDPWSDKQKNTPPDLDAILRNLRQRLQALLGKNNKQGNNQVIIGIIVAVALLLWGITGIFIVDPAEQAVVLRFGKYLKTVNSGPHWIPPLIETKVIRNVDKLAVYTYSAKLLTKDENIVLISVAIKYHIDNLRDYLYGTADPQESLHQATASAIQQVIGNATFNQIITQGREVWGQNVADLLKHILEQYKVGLIISSVSPQSASGPKEVQDAFNDVINAQEDEKRFKEQATAYAAKIIPTAEGKAKRITEAAIAYSKQAVLNAQGDVAEFLELLPEYLKSPALMRERLYLDTMETVLSKSNTIIIDSKNVNVVNLPLAQLLTGAQSAKPAAEINQLETTSNDSNVTSVPLIAHRTGARPESERSTFRGLRGTQ